MKLFDTDIWEEILTTISRNKTRSVLTAFGIFWGIFMLIILMGGAQGVHHLLSKNFEGFATNSGLMGTDLTSKPYKGFQQGRKWEMENKDVDIIKNSVEHVDVVTPTLSQWNVKFFFNNHQITGTLKGLYPEYASIEAPAIAQGRYINDIDIRLRRKVCIIGSQIANTLFPGEDNPCGKYIQINGIYHQVIGVSLSASNVSIQGNSESSVTIPFSTMQQNYNFGNKIQILCYTAKPGYKISQLEKEIERIVKKTHFIHPDDKRAVVKVNTEAMFSMMDSLFSGIKILGWMVGIGTLFAGAIGVSNIMMVTVKERTGEIGIRRAIGARPSDILQQILTESIVLTILAGMTGFIAAILILNVVNSIFSTPQSPANFLIDFREAIEACILLLIFGVIAGLAPAYRAMSIKPIEAIREE